MTTRPTNLLLLFISSTPKDTQLYREFELFDPAVFLRFVPEQLTSHNLREILQTHSLHTASRARLQRSMKRPQCSQEEWWGKVQAGLKRQASIGCALNDESQYATPILPE